MELLGLELGTHWANFGNVEPNPDSTMPWSDRLLLSTCAVTRRRFSSGLPGFGARSLFADPDKAGCSWELAATRLLCPQDDRCSAKRAPAESVVAL